MYRIWYNRGIYRINKNIFISNWIRITDSLLASKRVRVSERESECYRMWEMSKVIGVRSAQNCISSLFLRLRHIHIRSWKLQSLAGWLFVVAMMAWLQHATDSNPKPTTHRCAHNAAECVAVMNLNSIFSVSSWSPRLLSCPIISKLNEQTHFECTFIRYRCVTFHIRMIRLPFRQIYIFSNKKKRPIDLDLIHLILQNSSKRVFLSFGEAMRLLNEKKRKQNSQSICDVPRQTVR